MEFFFKTGLPTSSTKSKIWCVNSKLPWSIRTLNTRSKNTKQRSAHKVFYQFLSFGLCFQFRLFGLNCTVRFTHWRLKVKKHGQWIVYILNTTYILMYYISSFICISIYVYHIQICNILIHRTWYCDIIRYIYIYNFFTPPSQTSLFHWVSNHVTSCLCNKQNKTTQTSQGKNHRLNDPKHGCMLSTSSWRFKADRKILCQIGSSLQG